ncbi:hypothetical protein DSLASN_12230 [Desulfoluna limicola]|uniref:Acetyltransferase n=1 Tax=Desulfoluna limicola TaxID=2810562 RepID=A0ABM7PEJ7_9BACT|nr:hypothetical protein DSLASN_12230 [Desulfoluna limicola]
MLRWRGYKVANDAIIASTASIHGEMSLEIENNVFIGHCTTILGGLNGHIKISKNVGIAPHCIIINGTHKWEMDGDITRGEGKVANIVIEEGATLNANVFVSPGVTIGKMSILGAGSIVVHDIPSYCFAAGNPAKVIKKYNTIKKTWEQVVS